MKSESRSRSGQKRSSSKTGNLAAGGSIIFLGDLGVTLAVLCSFRLLLKEGLGLNARVLRRGERVELFRREEEERVLPNILAEFL